MFLTARTLIEMLSHYEDDDLIGIKQYRPGSDRVTVNIVEQNEVDKDTMFIQGEEKPVILLG